MKRTSIPALFILMALLLAACGSKATPTPAAAATEPGGSILALKGPNGGHALTMADLKILPVTEGQAGMKSSTGAITIPELYSGVAIKDLVSYLGVTFDSTMGVTVSAKDGYSMTLSYDQVMNGAFTAYDPANGSELKTHDPLTAIIAYAKNGQPLDPTDEGPLRLVVISVTNDQVVDGHWTVKWTNALDVEPVGSAWSLELQGAVSSPVDRASFQSCGSPSCHGTSWVDPNGQNWVGVPLWLLVGQVDDTNTHLDGAFNDALADAGYTVDIVGSDGYTVTLDSATIKRNNSILVAYEVNAAELPDQYYPLRLVGPALQSGQMVGKIVKIVVHVAPAATPTVAPAAPAASTSGAGLTISGLVNTPLTLTDADLHGMATFTITAQGKNGPQDFTGVHLNDLLNKAGIQSTATKLVFTASDNYNSEIDLTDVTSCPNALLAFGDTPGSYTVVLPDQPTSTWVKNLVTIEVK
jgi:DMSO/TMAO reductase YedYZ molybdopterin-dependent catalytic subunit